jgi:hypothetical protein
MTDADYMDDRNAKAAGAANLDELKALDIVGNAYHDMPLFAAADRLIVAPGLTRGEQREILRWVAEDVMGMDPEEITDEEIEEYEGWVKEERDGIV